MNKYIVDAWQFFIYGVLGRKAKIDLSGLPSEVSFNIHFDKKNKVYWIDAPELPEFFVSAKNKDDLLENFLDTLLVYMNIPTYFARHITVDKILNVKPQVHSHSDTQTYNIQRDALAGALA